MTLYKTEYFLGVWKGICQGLSPKRTHQKVPNLFIQEKKDTELKKARKLGQAFVCAQHFWSQDFLRGKTLQTTHAVRQSRADFYVAPVSSRRIPRCDPFPCHKKHGDPDTTILINRWYQMPSDSSLYNRPPGEERFSLASLWARRTSGDFCAQWMLGSFLPCRLLGPPQEHVWAKRKRCCFLWAVAHYSRWTAFLLRAVLCFFDIK